MAPVITFHEPSDFPGSVTMAAIRDLVLALPGMDQYYHIQVS